MWVITSDKFLSLEHIDKLLSFLTDRRDLAAARAKIQPIKDYYVIRTLLETGARVAEFCALIDGDLQGQKLLVRRGKGGKPRTILLTRSTMLLLREWTQVKSQYGLPVGPEVPLFPSRYGRAHTTRAIQKRVTILLVQAGLPMSLHTHSFRHTYCSLLLATGKAGIATVMANMGHSSIAVTNLYAHAIGNLDGIELFDSPSSQKNQKDEPGPTKTPPAPFKSSMKTRKTNLKRRDP